MWKREKVTANKKFNKIRETRIEKANERERGRERERERGRERESNGV